MFFEDKNKIIGLPSLQLQRYPRQKNIVDNAFKRIMIEEWSADLGLVVPRVEKIVDEPAILKAIDDSGAPNTSWSESPLRLAEVPQMKYL